jgi:preprotein translocase subunit SecB
MKVDNAPAAFSFDSYNISQFSYIEPKEDQKNIFVDFLPTGMYSAKDGLFTMVFVFVASFGEETREKIIDISMKGFFRFEPNTAKEDIPEYFYQNSIAIIYPYIRAFVSTLTALAGAKPLILPTLNLSSLSENLKANILYN